MGKKKKGRETPKKILVGKKMEGERTEGGGREARKKLLHNCLSLMVKVVSVGSTTQQTAGGIGCMVLVVALNG
jgi:hypothetical protein